MMKYLTLALAALVSFVALPTSASANSKQCVKNDSATSLSVHFYDQAGNAGAKNTNLTYGVTVCHTVSDGKPGYATVSCNGCGWAETAAKAAVVVAGSTAFGVCVVATSGECLMEGQGFTEATIEAVKAIPSSFKGKLVVVPGYNGTTYIKGNAFGLSVG
jgi:hypothetical protein